MALFVPGERLTGPKLAGFIPHVLAYGKRISNSSAATSTSAVGVLRLDDIPIYAGYFYVVEWSAHFKVSSGGDILYAQVHYTTDGSTPTTSDTVIPNSYHSAQCPSSSYPESALARAPLPVTSDGTLSVLLSFGHVSGTSNSYLLSNIYSYCTTMTVEITGENVGDTGVDV